MFNLDYKDEDKLTVFLEGDLDINTVKEFQDRVLNTYKDLDKDLIFDLKKLDYIDSTGLGAIITVFKEVKEKNRLLKIINAKKNIKKLFYITELDSLFEIGE
ncbi:MAG: STAS domain-containing protein [Tissierellia bacterium]|nr:STAS domain-containing protein [Tissierellia bacterium]